MIRTLSKRLQQLAAGALLLGAVCSTASAGALFQVTPGSLDPSVGASPFWATAMNGSSSARITFDNAVGFTYTGIGYIEYTSMTLNNASLPAFTTGLGNSYGMYATFEQHFICPAALNVGVTCMVASIDLKLFADLYNDGLNIFNQATVGSAPSVTAVGTQIKLADVTVVNSGLAGLNALGGAFQNINSNFALTAAGAAFFTSPVPFYEMAFSAFNNTSLGITCADAIDGGCSAVVAINSESGVTDFIGVPEPGPLALLGIGLLGFAVSRRKNRA